MCVDAGKLALDPRFAEQMTRTGEHVDVVHDPQWAHGRFAAIFGRDHEATLHSFCFNGLFAAFGEREGGLGLALGGVYHNVGQGCVDRLQRDPISIASRQGSGSEPEKAKGRIN